MATDQVVENAIIEWAATRSDEAVLHPTNSYYPFSVISEAYKQGVEHGEKNLKEGVRKKFFNNAKLVNEAVGKLLSQFQSDEYSPQKLFINISYESSKVFISIDEETYLSDKFMDSAYCYISDIQAEFFEKGLKLEVGFLMDNANLSQDNLKSDGFDVAIDLNSFKPLY